MSPQAPRLAFVAPDLSEPLYAGERRLRFELLRRPLGRAEGTERYDHEDDCLHLVAHVGATVVGCVLFHPDGQGGGRLLQMAVAEHLQGQGVGRRLVEGLEQRVLDAGGREIVLHARDHAIGFYERLGYTSFGEPYEEVGIPHRSMRKVLR